MPDAITSAHLPVTSASPGPPVVSYWENAYAIPLSISIAADDPATMIYYTIDGTTPTLASQHAQTPIGINVDSTITLSYFGVNSAGESTVRAELYGVNATNQSRAAFVITNVKLDGKSAVVDVTAGQQVMATSTAQVWVHSMCPTCPAQLVYGIDDTRQGCIYANVPGLYPGALTNPVFMVTAPATPGVYDVTVRLALEGTCGAAVANPGWEFRRVRIGTVVVR